MAKSFSWRFLGTTDTILVSFFVSGSIFSGFKIGLFETFSKIILYYAHERIWYKSDFYNPKIRHVLKTFCWRFIGTIDTIIISSLILGNLDLAFQVGLIEVLTKMILYYIHEKIWFRINFGLDNRKSKISRFVNNPRG